MSELVADFMRLGFLLTLFGFAAWVGGASMTAWVAWEKGREPVAWFVLAFFLSPLVALVALSAVPPMHVARRQRERAARRAPCYSKILRSWPAPRERAAREDKRWDVATSAATTTKRPW